jgi:hypothetical protein
MWGLLSLPLYMATAAALGAQELKLLSRPRVPALVGPDIIEPAPVLVVAGERTEVDGRRVTTAELPAALRTPVNVYRSLHPNEQFNGKILIACSPETSTRRLSEHLRMAREVGFPNPVFLLIQPNPAAKADRSADRITGAYTTTVKSGAANTLTVRDHPNCMSLVKAVIAVRNQGKVVFLDLGAGDGKHSSQAAAQQGVAGDRAAPER